MVHLCCQVIFSAKGLATDKTNHLVRFLSVLILVIVQLLEGLTGELVVLQWQHPLRIPRFFSACSVAIFTYNEFTID